MKSVVISVTETRPAPTTARSRERSASGEMRSFSRNRLRKWRVSVAWTLRAGNLVLPSGTEGRHGGEVTGDAGGIFPDDELREHAFERAARHQCLQVLDRIVGNHRALVKDDDA